MQEDFHYYATYCAAFLSGFSHEESMGICYSAQFVDYCSRTILEKIKAPKNAATTQLQLEMMDARVDILGLQDITRIWSSFHFLPKDLYAKKEKRSKRYMSKYRLICGPNGDLVVKTVENAKDKSLQHIGIAMHVLADTWAHANFAGTPSLVINNVDNEFYEYIEKDGKEIERKVKFRHNPSAADDLEQGLYTNSLYQGNENSIMNLGHGRAGHFPDYSFAKYRYLPAWGDYDVIIKDNPHDYERAFAQMVRAMKFLNGTMFGFDKNMYDESVLEKYGDRIREIICKRQLIANDDWKQFGQELSGCEIESFDIKKYQDEYINAGKDEKGDTFIGKFIEGALSQKGMVTNEIYESGSKLAGFSKVVNKEKGLGL
ncbi:DUF6765 family protein [Butyrivibrio sp. YAB3001]|uniref:DUF6765 family protein n=1 Tax=Butyrivibrio sp. YAB3001 TaxID=1520812 RepID=UPI0008F619BA|nr:DUF6765 family protein [Butyrivibrio sp. YAB3001]SFD09018.1 hypothetical protein SAMN02910398_04020 [Butyrivibrio sp. YAB3001]